MLSLEETTNILRNHKHNLFLKYPIKEMSLFGSIVRGESHAGSDVDILVELSQPMGYDFIDLLEELENILNSKVDLVSKKGIKSKYFEFIKNELIYV